MRSELTQFGKFIRKLRIDNGMIMKDLAENLNVSPSFLSAVETGKKAIPNEWIEKIITIFNLDSSDVKELDKAVFYSRGSLELEKSKSEDDNELILSFARKIHCLSDEQKEGMLKILKER